MEAAAVNVTELPVQIVFVPDMEMPGATGEETVMVNVFDVAGLFETEPSLEVITQYTVEPVVNELVV